MGMSSYSADIRPPVPYRQEIPVELHLPEEMERQGAQIIRKVRLGGLGGLILFAIIAVSILVFERKT